MAVRMGIFLKLKATDCGECIRIVQLDIMPVKYKNLEDDETIT